MNNHCCKEMKFFLEEGSVSINFDSTFKRYSLALLDGFNRAPSAGTQQIKYCPWCGSKLPINLSDQWFAELEKLGFDEPFEQIIPEEFKSDEWWKKKESLKRKHKLWSAHSTGWNICRCGICRCWKFILRRQWQAAVGEWRYFRSKFVCCSLGR
jgi:hypothetical protein